MTKLRSPIVWFGGKGNMSAKILPFVGKPLKYIEVFGGGGTILCGKEPFGLEVYNDLDRGLYEFFTVLSDEVLFGQFYRRVSVLPHHRTQFDEFKVAWQSEEDLVKRVAMWFVVARQSFSGRFGSSFGTATNAMLGGMARCTKCWLSCLNKLPELHARLQRVQFENQSFETIFKRYDSEDAFFYVDPPYVTSTRKYGGYAHEMTDEQHGLLIEILNGLEGRYLLSGYPNALYEDGLRYKHKEEFETACSAAGRTASSNLKGKGAAMEHQKRTEVLWMNYVPPAAKVAEKGLF